jgi:uncharacterized protein
MSEENIPEKVDPFRFADNAIRLQGSLRIKDMPRLCESLHDDTGEIGVNIEFGKNEQGIRFVTGQLSGALHLQCQRCMEPLEYPVANKIWLAIVHTEEEAEKLPQGYDPVIANDDILVIRDMVEDELIVSLPVVPMHSHKDCKVTLPLIIESEQTVEMEKENPFKVIEFLRAKSDKK